MEEALPAGAQVYLPPLIVPNISFQQVAVASLQDRRFYTDAPTFFPGALPGLSQPGVRLRFTAG